MRWYHFVRVRKTLQTSARNGRYLLQGGVTLTGQALSGLVPSPPHRGGAASAARRVRVLAQRARPAGWLSGMAVGSDTSVYWTEEYAVGTPASRFELAILVREIMRSTHGLIAHAWINS